MRPQPGPARPRSLKRVSTSQSRLKWSQAEHARCAGAEESNLILPTRRRYSGSPTRSLSSRITSVRDRQWRGLCSGANSISPSGTVHRPRSPRSTRLGGPPDGHGRGGCSDIRLCRRVMSTPTSHRASTPFHVKLSRHRRVSDANCQTRRRAPSSRSRAGSSSTSPRELRVDRLALTRHIHERGTPRGHRRARPGRMRRAPHRSGRSPVPIEEENGRGTVVSPRPVPAATLDDVPRPAPWTPLSHSLGSVSPSVSGSCRRPPQRTRPPERLATTRDARHRRSIEVGIGAGLRRTRGSSPGMRRWNGPVRANPTPTPRQRSELSSDERARRG